MKFLLTLLAIFTIATSLYSQELSLDNVNWSGDLRYRYNLTMIEDMPDAGQSLVRFRVNADWSANDHINLITQIATNANDPLSNDIPIYTDNINFKLNRIYVDWHTDAVLHNAGHEIHVYAGRQPLPFYVTTAHFDSDLNLEGAAATINDDQLFANIGGFWVDDARTPNSPGLVAAQAGGHFGNFMLAGAFYNYLNTKEHPAVGQYGFGNTLDESGMYANEYQVIDGNATYTYKSLTLGANYLYNVGADEDNQAWSVGVDGNFTHLTTSVWYSETKPDAILGTFADNESGGGTNAKTFMFAAYVSPYNNTQIGGKYYVSQFNPWSDYKYSDNRAYVDFLLDF